MGIFLYLITLDNFEANLAIGIIFGICGSLSFAILLNFGGEIIYPESESTSTTIIMMLTNGAAVVILEILHLIIQNHGHVYGSGKY